MEVKRRYKQTEIQVTPEDWRVMNLLSICSEPMQNGVFYQPLRKGAGIKLVNVKDLYTPAPIDSDALELFDASETEKERFKVKDGDLFFTRSSVVPSGIAHCNLYSSDRPEPVVFDSHIIRVRPDTKKVVPSYLLKFCTSPMAREYLVSHAKTGTMTTIDQGVLGHCPILLPPLPEQRAIAEVLSDVDALLAALDRLIAKKRAIKQGAMQQLLSGQRRLSSFSRQLDSRLLGEVVRITKGQLITGNGVEDGDVPVIAGGKRPAYFHNKANRFGMTITISASGANAGYVSLHRRPIYASDCSTIDEGEGYDLEFVFYQLESKQGIIYAMQTGGAQPHVHAKDLHLLRLWIPDGQEQRAIAEVLCDMDAEIAGLETRREKTHALKQGIMQELLTGKRRLR